MRALFFFWMIKLVPRFLRRPAVFLLRLSERTSRANLGMSAAAVAFFGFLAVFPGLAAIVTIWGYAADPVVIQQELQLWADVLPEQAYDLLSTQVESLLSAGRSALGWASVLSTALALWSVRSGVAALISGINGVHHWPERHGLRHLVVALVLTLALVTLALAALLAAVVVPIVLKHVPLGTTETVVLEGANTMLALGLVTLGVGLAYRYGPNWPKGHRVRLLTPGLAVALTLWALVSRGFVIYLANFNSYNQIYGSIGAVAVLLIWLYLSSYALLLGAAVDAELGRS